MSPSVVAQTLPVLTLATLFCGDEEEDKTTTVSLRGGFNDKQQDQQDCARTSDGTCSTASASGRTDESEASDVSDSESTPSSLLRRHAASPGPRWADCDSDDEDHLWGPSPCLPAAPTLPASPSRTPLCGYAKGFVPRSATNNRLDFGKVVAAGLMAMRSSPIVASSEVQESAAGGGWSLSCCLRSDIDEKFTAIKAITQQVQTALLQASEMSQKSYILGYDAEPFAPLGLGFSLQLAAVQDETQACWDLIGTGYCARGCSCRWQHPVEYASIQVRIALSVG